MRKILFSAIVIFSFTIVVSRTDAVPKKNPATNTWYDIVVSDPGAKNLWFDAEEKAWALGGHLASISSVEENDWVYFNFVNGTNRNYWIGLNDMNIEGGLSWPDGEPVAYTNWHTAWRNTDGRDYAFIRQSDSQWDMGYKNDYRLGVAEWQAATPEPCQAGLFIFGGAILILTAYSRKIRKTN